MRVFADMEEMDIPFQQAGLNTTQKYIAKNPDVVRRVVKSIVEGIQLIRANPAVSKRAIARYMKIKSSGRFLSAAEGDSRSQALSIGGRV